MSVDQETIEYFTEVFRNSLATDDEQRNSATQLLNEMFAQEPIKCIHLFSSLLNDAEHVPLLTRRCSVISLSRVLRPYSPEMMRNIRETWNNPDNSQLIANLKTALFKTVLDEDVVVRNNSCNVFALVFSIENGTWIEAMQQIANNIGNAQIADIGRIGLFRIFIEILNMPNFKAELNKPNLVNYYLEIFMAALQVLKAPVDKVDFSVDLRNIAATCVYYTISSMSDAFDESKLPQIVPMILDSLTSSFPIQNTELFQTLHKIMFIMLKQFYTNAHHFIGTVLNYTFNGMALREQPDFQNIAVFTWQQIAEMEYNIKKKSPQLINQPLCGICLDKLFFVLVRIMLSIPHNDIDVEDLNKPIPSMYAASTLQSIYKVVPDLVFQICYDDLKKYIVSNDWVEQHTGLLLLYCITDNPTNSSMLVPLINEVFQYIIEYCRPNHCNHLRETALFLLGFILKQYKEIVSDKRICMNQKEMVDRILSVIDISTNNTHPQIIQRYAMIIYHLSEAWENNKYNSLIGEYFSIMYEHLNNMLIYINYIIENNNNFGSMLSGLYSTIFESMNMLFLNVPEDSLDHCLIKSGLYDSILQKLFDSRSIMQSSDIIFAIQAGLCSNISTMTIKLRRKIIDKANDAIAVIFYILQNKNSLIYEEGLMALASFVYGCTECIHDELLQRLANIAKEGLCVDSPNVISASSILLNDLFKYLKDRMDVYVDNTYEILYNLIINHPEMKDIHPYVIRAMAQMFDSLSNKPECLEKYEDSFIQLLSTVKKVSFSLNFDIKADVEYANNLYRSLAEAYASYAKNFYATIFGITNETIALERKQLFELADFANCILQIKEYNISDELIMSFITAALQFADKCSRKNNVILNRNKIHQVLEIGARRNNSNKIPSLSKRAKDAAKTLKSK